MGAPDSLLETLRYGGDIGLVVLGGTGPLWLWERVGGSFTFSEEMNRSQITSSSSESCGLEWQRDQTLDPFSMLKE